MKKYSILLIPFILWSITGCETPTGEFKRTNSNDPYSPTFRGGTVTGLQVSADTSGIITVLWGESDDIVSRNVLEKSLGDTLNYITIAELKPEIRQFTDSSLTVRKNTFYRLSSYIELAGDDDKLYGKSQTELTFGRILNLAAEFLGENNSVRLTWNTDLPFYTHFIISSENVISELQEKSVRIPAEGIVHGFMDPMPDIDFETRNYTITGIIEHDGTEEVITEQAISFNAVTFFQPANAAINILNEQDWEISWAAAPYFATSVEVTRFNDDEDIISILPKEATSLIDSLLIFDTRYNMIGIFRRYQVRYLTDRGASRDITIAANTDIQAPVISQSNLQQVDPNSLTLRWVMFGPDKNLIKEFIIESPLPYSPDRFREIARVNGNTFQYTFNNVNESQQFTYRVRTITSYPSDPATFTYSHDYELSYSISTGMNYVTSMEATADNRYLTAVSFRSGQGNSILITDIELKQKIAEITIPSGQISDFKISPAEDFIYFTVPTEGAIYRADFPAGNNIVKIINDASLGTVGVYHIDVSNDGSFIIGTGGRGFVKRWNLKTYEPEFIFSEFNSPTFYLYKNIAISPDGALIGGNNGTTYIMDAQNGSILTTLPWASPNMTDIQFSADGSYFAFVANFSMTSIYSTANWEHIQTFSSTKRADFHPEKNKMVIVGNDKVFTFDLETLRIVDTIYSESGWAVMADIENAITYIDDSRIATVSGSRIEIWNRKDSKGWKRAM
jgi:WD40 repeat protein